MRKSHSILIGAAPGMICAAIALAVAFAALRAAEPATPDDRIAELCANVLNDPLDEAAVSELAKLRQTQQTQRKAAFEALAEGLELYLKHSYGTAAEQLRKADSVAHAADMADAILVRRLADVIRECERKAKETGKGGPCELCGGTGLADCAENGCGGSGIVRCAKCQGRGKTARIKCADCDGRGYVDCPACKGTGAVPCTCSRKAGAAVDGSAPAPDERAAIERVIAKARYLSGGGIDFDLKATFEVSPKTAK